MTQSPLAAVSAIHRGLFEIENARNLTRDELVATFVPTKAFFRLLSAKNHIVLGSRGSGKTAIAKMLSHDHLSRLPDEAARDVIAKRSIIGIYVPTRLEWVSGLKNKPWQTPAEAEQFFQWRLNVSVCLALITAAQSCLEQYVRDLGQRARAERDLALKLSAAWCAEADRISTLSHLRERLEDVEYEYQQALLWNRINGTPKPPAVGALFSAELFSPLRRGIALTKRVIDLQPDATWLVCLDEAEVLTVDHHRILNSHLRSFSGELAFKITTMPYAHYTLETNTGVPLDVGHDFEYVYIDQDPVRYEDADSDDERFAVTIFNKRAKASGGKYRELAIKEMLGPSILLDSQEQLGDEQFTRLLHRYANAETVARAARLRCDPPGYGDQIYRKLQGALILRDAVLETRGRGELSVYSGATLAIRCGDGNPRRLIRIFNALLMKTRWHGAKKRRPVLSPKEQTRVLTAVSTSTLTRIQSEPHVGPALYEFLRGLGDYMRYHLFERPLGTDQVSSVEVDADASDSDWTLIQRAVGIGLLYPNISANNPDEMPERKGVYRLAYVLAPHFRLMPRRGKPRRLSSMRQFMLSERVPEVDTSQQPNLFSNDELV